MSDRAAQSAASASGASAYPDNGRRPGRIDALDDLEARQLMLRVGQGDYQAFEVLFSRYHAAVFNFYLKLCRDQQLAEDGVQETFLRVWRAASRYHPSAAFRTYLFQIAKNYWLNEQEKLERRRAVSLDSRPATGRPSEGTARTLHESLTGDGPDPATAAEQREALDQAEEILAELDEKHRIVLVLSHFHGFRYREIAEILDIPEGTVKTRMYHAERKLRAALERREATADGGGRQTPEPS